MVLLWCRNLRGLEIPEMMIYLRLSPQPDHACRGCIGMRQQSVYFRSELISWNCQQIHCQVEVVLGLILRPYQLVERQSHVPKFEPFISVDGGLNHRDSAAEHTFEEPILPRNTAEVLAVRTKDEL